MFHCGVVELAGDRRGGNGEYLVFCVVFRFPDYADAIQNIRFIGNGAEGALVDAGAAGDALVVVDGGLFVFAHVDRPQLCRRFRRPGGI